MKGFNLPLLLVGGGGYTIRNVARAWTHETAIALNQEIPNGNFYRHSWKELFAEIPSSMNPITDPIGSDRNPGDGITTDLTVGFR